MWDTPDVERCTLGINVETLHTFKCAASETRTLYRAATLGNVLPSRLTALTNMMNRKNVDHAVFLQSYRIRIQDNQLVPAHCGTCDLSQ